MEPAAAPKKAFNGQFTAGNPGRRVGSKNKSTAEIKQFAADVLLGKSPGIYRENLRKRIMAGEAPHMEKFFAEHLWGKPKESIDLNITKTHISVLLSLSDLELAAFVEAMTQGHQEDALKMLPGWVA